MRREEQIICIRIYQTVEDLRKAINKFVELYNRKWRIEGLNFISPNPAITRDPRKLLDRLGKMRLNSVLETGCDTGKDQLKANAVQTFAARNQGKDKAEQIIFRTV